MPTGASLRSEIIEDLKKYDVTNDLQIDLELIDDKIVEANLSVLQKFYNSKMSLEGFYMIVPSVSVVCQRDTCTIGGFTFADRTIYYKAILPALVKFIGDSNISYFGLFGFEEDISRLELPDFVARKHSRWSGGKAIYALIGDTAVLKNIPEGFSAATLVCIPEDPRAIPGFDWETSNFPTASPEAIKVIVKNSITQTPLVPDLVGGSQTAAGGNQQPKQPKQQQEEE